MYDLATAAKKLGISKLNLFKKVQNKKIKHARIGKKIMFRDEFVEEYISAATVDPTQKEQAQENKGIKEELEASN